MAETTRAPEGAQDQAREKAQQVAGQAQQSAQQAAGQVSERMRSEVDRRSTEAGRRVSQSAEDLQAVRDQLRDRGREGPARIAEQAADRAKRIGGYLEGNDADTILDDVEDVARSNPWAVVAGGIALGFAASRFLKASSRGRYERRGGRTPGQPPVGDIAPAASTPTGTSGGTAAGLPTGTEAM